MRRGLEHRTDLVNSRKSLQSSDISLRYFRNLTLPAVDLVASYGSQGIGGTQHHARGPGFGRDPGNDSRGATGTRCAC